MHSKSSLPLDIQHATTAFQAAPDWHKEYWLKPASSDATDQHIHRRRDGSIDYDFYRSRAKRERDAAAKEFGLTVLSMMVRWLRLTEWTLRANETELTPSIPATILRRLRTTTKAKL